MRRLQEPCEGSLWLAKVSFKCCPLAIKTCEGKNKSLKSCSHRDKSRFSPRGHCPGVASSSPADVCTSECWSCPPGSFRSPVRFLANSAASASAAELLLDNPWTIAAWPKSAIQTRLSPCNFHALSEDNPWQSPAKKLRARDYLLVALRSIGP